MTNAKSTKRSLLFSVLALVVCVTMLIGTTFAWFTDKATTGVNTIVAGNLDVEMYYADGTLAPASATYANAEGAAIFNYTLWEPGYTVAKHIKIANEGDLALKYQLDFMLSGEVGKLAEVIDVYFADPAVQVANRSDVAGLTKVGTLKEFLEGSKITPEKGILAGGKSVIVTIVLKMQETADNTYKNATVGDGLTIRLYATQNTVETDSFDKFYDKDALFNYEALASNDAELAAALADTTKSTIYLAKGSYSPFTVGRDNVTIKGVLGATKAESSVITNTATDKLVLGAGTFNDDSNLTVTEIHKLKAVDGVTVENLWIDASAASGFNSWDCDVGIIVTPYYENAKSYSTNTTITGCYIEGSGNNTLTLALGDGFTFTNNTIKNFETGFYAETNAIKTQLISGNTYENVKNAVNYVMSKGAQANITITDNTVVDTTVFTLCDYAQWTDRNSTTTTASAFKSITISGNNGNINYNLTHFDNRAKTPCSITLGTGEQSINYINGVAFDIAYADRENYTITNTDGSALDRTTQGRSTLTMNITVNGVKKAACYELASGTYYIVNNTTGVKYEFTVTVPVVGVQQYVELTNVVG